MYYKHLQLHFPPTKMFDICCFLTFIVHPFLLFFLSISIKIKIKKNTGAATLIHLQNSIYFITSYLLQFFFYYSLKRNIKEKHFSTKNIEICLPWLCVYLQILLLCSMLQLNLMIIQFDNPTNNTLKK